MNYTKSKKAPAEKECVDCGKMKANTEEFFSKAHAYATRLRTVCKECRK